MQISARLVVNKAALKLDREPIRALIDSLAAAVAAARAEHGHRAVGAAHGLGQLGAAASTPALAALLAYSAETDRAIEASVEAILADVRARGDAAVLEYTRRFDAIDAGSMAALEVGPAELARRARGAAFGAAPRARRRRGAHPRLPRAPARRVRPLVEPSRRRRQPARPEGDADRARRHLRARRQGGVPVERAHERDPGEGRGRRRDRHGRADAARRASATRSSSPPPRSPASTGCSRSAARRRSARSPTERRRFPPSTRSPAPATPTSRAPSGASSARSAST